MGIWRGGGRLAEVVLRGGWGYGKGGRLPEVVLRVEMRL